MRKPRFNRKMEFVFVKHYRPAKKAPTHEPGDPVDPTVYRLHRIRILFKRNIIGPVGSKWTNQMLEHGFVGRAQNAGVPKTSDAQKVSGFSETEFAQLPTSLRHIILSNPPPAATPKASQVTASVEGQATGAEVTTSEEGSSEYYTVTAQPGGYYLVHVPGQEDQRVRGKAKATALLAQYGIEHNFE